MMLSAMEEMRHDVVGRSLEPSAVRLWPPKKCRFLLANYLEVYNPRRLYLKLCIHLLIDL